MTEQNGAEEAPERPPGSGTESKPDGADGPKAPDGPAPTPAGAPEAPCAGNHIEVARTRETVIFRVVGLGNMRVAMGLMGFSEAMLGQGYVRFAFDLAECRGLDSTFMGAMVGLAADAAERDGWVTVVNASESAAELLQIVGADKFLRMRGAFSMEPIETTRLPEVHLKPQERLDLVRRAHERLVEIDRRNEKRFGSFLRQLTSELSK